MWMLVNEQKNFLWRDGFDMLTKVMPPNTTLVNLSGEMDVSRSETGWLLRLVITYRANGGNPMHVKHDNDKAAS
jgi:hypothetical protein